jgi:hypothetical protein
MSPSDKLYALGVMLGGLGIVAALVRWEEIAERLFPKCRLRALCGPGESYSDVILRLCEIEARDELR